MAFSGKAALFGLIFWVTLGNAFASPTSLNVGASFCNTISSNLPTGATPYALTGTAMPGFKPEHSRAWYAVAFGFTNILVELIEKKPALVKNKELLSLAAISQSGDSLAELLSHGADPNMVLNDTGLTMLGAATLCQHTINMIYLLNAGAKLYQQDPYGGNVMGVAATGGYGNQLVYFHGVKMLLAAGYDPLCYVQSTKHLTLYGMLSTLLNNEEKKSINPKLWPALARAWMNKLRSLTHIVKNAMDIKKARGGHVRDCSIQERVNQQSMGSTIKENQ